MKKKKEQQKNGKEKPIYFKKDDEDLKYFQMSRTEQYNFLDKLQNKNKEQ